ncbi:AraC family transcriptional regulator [Paenibacillus sp. NPDC058174]|uniref:helix-turn-helix transcriptional regulator n=1 Tax=Paenibacillus sp. NPDC058174 TaxID=3346366 RepID=UPI0036DBDF36
MKLSTTVDVRKEPFHLNYCKTSNQQTWEVFHAHQSMELLYVHEGEGDAYIHGKVFPIQPGTLLLFQPFQLHRLEMNRLYVRTILMFDPYPVDTALVGFPALQHFFKGLWKSKLANPVLYFSPTNNELLVLYERLHQRLQHVPSHKIQEEYMLFLLSALQLLRLSEQQLGLTKQTAPEQETFQTIKRVLSWVDTHYRDKFVLEKLADDLHLSSYYLSHSFSDKTGSSLTQYISSRRIKEACLLLETTTKSVGAIADEVGFQQVSYFCRVFKGMLGVTPKRYRTAAWDKR